MECTLLLERSISNYLAMLLDIDINNNSALGNKSGGLSFNHKVLLMIDIKAIDARSKSKFQKLVEIRNKFAHDYDCYSFSICYSQIEGVKKFLEKNYGSKISIEEKEKRNEMLFFELFVDLFETLDVVLQRIWNSYQSKK